MSFLCYTPSLLEQHEIYLPLRLFRIKYLFVCVPAITTILLLLYEHGLMRYFINIFSGKVAVRHILTWFTYTVAGIFVSYGYSTTTGTELFQDSYPTIAALLINCIYLFITGFVEEIAWRGFLLERVSSGGKSLFNILFVGIAWTIWHMPMWIIRNSLSAEEIVYLCVWTILVSYVLGTIYCQCKNVLLIALIHATFNISYLAPIQYNIAVVTALIAIGAFFTKRLG